MANYLGYHQITLYPCAAQTPTDYSAQKDITLYQSDAIPADMSLRQMGLVVQKGLAEITLRMTLDPMEVLSGVYPGMGDVDYLAAKYGPTGMEYSGTLRQPDIADVKTGVYYGADGTEFTGTLAGGGSLNAGTVLIDPITGNKYIYVTNRIIVGVN